MRGARRCLAQRTAPPLSLFDHTVRVLFPPSLKLRLEGNREEVKEVPPLFPPPSFCLVEPDNPIFFFFPLGFREMGGGLPDPVLVI